MPTSFGFTSPEAREHNIFIRWALPADMTYMYFVAIIPAFLVYILLFVEIEITELILARRERGMRKGFGFHWDLLGIAFLTLLCSVLGLPWMCSAAVQSFSHCNSLTVMKKVTAPGEVAKVERVIEERVTTIIIALLIGRNNVFRTKIPS
jgi:hypothetical protein